MLDDDGIAIERTDGARRVDGLLQPARCMVKTSDSAFHDTALAELLRDGDVDRLVLAGVPRRRKDRFPTWRTRGRARPPLPPFGCVT